MEAIRFENNPIVTGEMIDDEFAWNINGPSLIRVPDWVEDPLGRYYLYFAAHHGPFIRLAFADELAGPWRVHPGGTLHVDDTPCFHHIASPDVHVDEDERQIRMNYHGSVAGPDGEFAGQRSFVAVSQDGLSFVSDPEPAGVAYLRTFRWDGWFYGICNCGYMMRSPDGRTDWQRGPNLLAEAEKPMVARHPFPWRRGQTLWALYSRIGDEPERIMIARVPLTGDWSEWKPEPSEVLLQPETDYEGVELPVIKSSSGPASEPLRQLRDPAIYEEDGRSYLLYAAAGESAIAIAELIDED